MKRIVGILPLLLLLSQSAPARDYAFDGSISEPVLRGYLARSITYMDLLTGQGDLDDNVRLLKETGVKFAGRAFCLWGAESDLPRRLELARKAAARIHQSDPEIVLQACIFEIVTPRVEELAIPDWAFRALDMPVEDRHFHYEAMLYPDGRFRNHWGNGSVPDVSRPETKLWFYYAAASYIDAGIEAIHFGQVELMNRSDPQSDHWFDILQRIRAYASEHARRHWLICDGHVPGGGLRRGEQLLLDFHSFPLRIAEVPEKPQEGVLKMGFLDSIYGRSRGGIAPSGWRCEHLPYLVELDNWGRSHRPGEAGVGGAWIWGYDEISWFAHQPEAYRNAWLGYAWKWVRQHDPAGYLEMPGSRCLHAPVDGKDWYRANRPSPAVPDGFGQEDAIREIWKADE